MHKFLEGIFFFHLLMASAVAASATELISRDFTAPVLEGSNQSDWFNYRVRCDESAHCSAFLKEEGVTKPYVLLGTLHRSEVLRAKIKEDLVVVRSEGYPASKDEIYKLFDGLRVTDCWDSGQHSGQGGLCRFESKIGVETWIVLWGDMCSASCFSKFVPIIVRPI